MSLSLSWWQRLIVLTMLVTAAAVLVLDQPKAASSVHTARAPSYADDFTTVVNPSRDLSAARPHQVRQPAASLAQKRHRPRHIAAPAPVTAAPLPPSPQPLPPAPAPVSAVQNYALSLVGSVQFVCLLSLWDVESGWNYQAENPSGAFGIPQALPGSKMAAAGPDWMTNPYTQVKWGVLDYIDPVYGSACNAWAHEEADGWY
jgi:hypothetical protein